MNLKIKNVDKQFLMLDKQKEISKHNKNNKQSIQANELNLHQENALMKKINAQKKAIKTVINAFNGEYRIDDSIKGHQMKVQELTVEANRYNGEIDRLAKLQDGLKETYNISDDSQEQKDLELIIKGRNGKELTGEEKELLKNMGPLTEYQKVSLEYEDDKDIWKKRLDNVNNNIMAHNQAVEFIKLEEVKTHTMVDANKTAENILLQASKEVISILVDEAKDNLDEDLEETVLQAKKKAEEEKEKKEKLEKNKEKNTLDDKMDDLNNIPKADNLQDKLQQEIQLMLNKQKMIDDDIKGISVDEQI